MSVDADPNWELRLIAVEWADKQAFTIVAEAESALLLTRETGGFWTAFVPTYPRIGHRHAQLAIRSDVAPVLMLADGTVRTFMQLDGTRWWIEKYKFVREKDGGPYWRSTLNAKAGHADLKIADKTIQLTLLPSDWTWEQILELEQDLRGLALSLLVDLRSSAHVEVQEERRRARFDRVSAAVKRLHSAADQIQRRPISALTSSVRWLAQHRAKPCAAGIIDAARRPGRRFIRSRVVEESIDVPENRYLVHLLARTRSLLRLCQVSITAEAITQVANSDRLAAEIAGMQSTAPEVVPVEPEELDREQQVLEQHLTRIRQWATADRHFYETWVEHRPDVRFPQLYLQKVVDNKIERLDQHRAERAAAGWARPTTPGEKNEYVARLSALKTQAGISSQVGLQMQERANELALLDQSIEYNASRWRALGVSPSSIVPASTSMHSRPTYLRALSAYRDLMREFGCSTTAGLFLEAPDSVAVGIVDLWLLFERWCLLQVVTAICNIFAVRDPDLRQRAVRAALAQRGDRSENEVFHFGREGLSCTLELEPRLRTIPGGDPKYPDFKIEIKGGLNDVVAIVDVKCKRYRESLEPGDDPSLAFSLPSLSGEIKAMYYGPYTPGGERNYSMSERNRVFVLHPSVNAVRPPNPAQAWSRHSYYGERAINSCQGSPNHQYGGVYMRPRSSRDLQRLLMLLVHAALLPRSRGEIPTRMQQMVPCATCGGTLMWGDSEVTEGGFPKYSATYSTCRECHMFTHCVLCGQRLVKAGWHATYHSLAGQIGNVHCPCCQTAL